MHSWIYVASSFERGIQFIKDSIAEHKLLIEKCEQLLQLYNLDECSFADTMSSAINMSVVFGSESVDNIHAGFFRTDEILDPDKIALHMRTSIERSLGVSLDSPDTTITLHQDRYYSNFYIDNATVLSAEEQYADSQPVASRLHDVWRNGDSDFDIRFVHSPPTGIDNTFFKRKAKYISSEFTYDELYCAITRQLAIVITQSGRTKPAKKSSMKPIQFVLSPAAAKTVELTRRCLVFEYSSTSAIDYGKYYGMTSPLVVHCYQRPNGTISLISESLPENTLVLSKEQYNEYTKRKTGMLDALMEGQ